MAAIHAEAKKAGRGALIVLHTPWGGGADGVVKEWRRHVLAGREHLFEGNARPDGTTYRPIREIVARYVQALDDLGLLDDQTAVLASQVGDTLGLSWSEARGETPERAGQLAFFERIGELLIRLGERLPATLIVHEFHRADSASRAALMHIFANVVTDPVARLSLGGVGADGFAGTVVVTTSEAEGALANLRAELTDRPNVHFLSLEESERQQIRDLLTSADVLERLMRASSGSPDQLRELLDAIPERADALILDRLERRSRVERKVLETLAVLRRAVKPDVLLRLADVGDETPSFSSLAESRLIVRQVNRGELLVDFPSPEHRDVIYQSIPEAARRMLHGRIAEMLEERSRLGASVDLEVIAGHYLASDDDAKASRYALEAADRLTIAFAFQRAAELLEQLLARAERRALRIEVLERLADVYAHLQESEAALRALAELATLVDGVRQVDVQTRRARLLLESGTPDRAREVVADARALLEGHELAADEERPRRDELDVIAAEAAYATGQYDEATRVASDALGRPGEMSLLARIRLRNTLGKVALFRGQYTEASESFGENQRAAHEAGFASEEVRALFNLGTIALQRRRYEDAERIFHQSLNFGEATSSPVTRSFLQLNLGVVYHRTLRYGEALRAYLGSLAMFRRSGNDLQYAVTALNLGSLYETLGDFERARAALETSLAVTGRRDIRYFRGRGLFVLGLVELASGRHDAARTTLTEAQRLLGGEGSAFGARIQVALARAAHAAARPSLRDELLARAHTNEETPDGEQARAEVDLYAGYFAAMEGRGDEGRERMERALLVFEEQAAHESIWLARLFLAEFHTRRGSLGRALGLARSAWDLIEHIAVQIPDAIRARYLDGGDRSRVRDLVEHLESLQAGVASPRSVAPPERPSPADAGFAAWRRRYGSIVGNDDRLIQILQLIDRVSQSDSSVLLQGESGTGKELIAEAIHRQSGRANRPFVKVNCAAFVESLLLSELFGHEKGAFTGAMSRRKGRFELADGGTLFLDEIGDISPNTQVALLRVLQERTFERVGGNETLQVNVRLICATNRNLEEMVRAGTFRLDLYYRLKGVVLELPALRDRRSDIPLLIRHFMSSSRGPSGRERRISDEALEWLARYSWPGNVRELENFTRSLLLFVDGDEIELAHVRQFEDFFADGEFAPPASAAPASGGDGPRVARSTPSDGTTLATGARRPRTLLDLPVPTVPENADNGSTHHGATSPTASSAGPAVSTAASRGASKGNAVGDAYAADAPDVADPAHDPVHAGLDEEITGWMREGVGLPELKRRIEVEMIRRALEASGGNIAQAARAIDMKRSRLSQIVHGTPELERFLDVLVQSSDVDDASG